MRPCKKGSTGLVCPFRWPPTSTTLPPRSFLIGRCFRGIDEVFKIFLSPTLHALSRTKWQCNVVQLHPSLVTVIWCVVICTHIFVDFTDTYLASAWIFVIEQKIQNYVISHSLAEWWKLSSIVCAHQLAHHYLFYPISLDVVFPPICLIALQTVIDDRRPQSGWKDVMRFCSWHNATPDISQCKGPVIISRTFSPEIRWKIQHTST